MSPEYAMEGRFSEKSDIYSLGVLVLEIVSGRKKGGFHDGCLSLLSYVSNQKSCFLFYMIQILLAIDLFHFAQILHIDSIV